MVFRFKAFGRLTRKVIVQAVLDNGEIAVAVTSRKQFCLLNKAMII